MTYSIPPRPGRGRRWPTAVLTALLALAAGLPVSGSAAVAGATVKGVIGQPSRQQAASGSGRTLIEPALLRGLQAGQSSSFVIEFRERADLSGAFRLPWQQRGRFVHEQLRQAAERSQAAVHRALRARGLATESFWIKNALLVRNADIAALQVAAGFDQVARIRSLPDTRLIDPQPVLAAAPRGSSTIAENIVQVGADQVWAQGTTGSGVTVGVIDTGVDYRHAALVRQYRGNRGDGTFEHDYNWLGLTPEPSPGVEAHGTHVIGTIVGDNHADTAAARRQVGMAPGARWIGCDAFPKFGDPTGAVLLRCGQFMLAPTRGDGSDANPDLRPQVVNNSWSEQDCDGTASPFYADMVEAWVAAGIFPAFAAGNSFSCGLPEPPGLSTLSSPASLGSAFAIGSSGNHDGEYAAHSLWGPTDDASPGLPQYPDPRGFPQLKPQVVAPGVAIESASIDGNDAYAGMTGTSMSTPHVSGLVALMLDAGSCLAGDFAALGGLIMQTARPIAYASGGTPAPGPGNIPNHATGWGEIDAQAAVNAAADACGPNGLIAGSVRGADGAIVAGASIRFLPGGLEPAKEATSDASGTYARRLAVEPGTTYTVQVSAYGHLPYVEAGVQVAVDQTTRLDVILPIAPAHKISGVVRDAETGWPLHARISVAGSPLAPFWTDALTGAYSVRLPEGGNYRFDVVSDIDGYQNRALDLGQLGGGGNVDIALQADPVACDAPGYAHAGSVLAQDFEAGGLPAGWSRSSNGLGWQFGSSTELSSAGFAIPAHGQFAAANDELGNEGGWANDARFDFLVLPPLNLDGLDRPALRYRSFFTLEPQPWGSREPARVEGSVDGGVSWLRLGRPSATTFVAGWSEEAVDLAPVIGPATLIRFHADDLGVDDFDTHGPGWAVDDVAVRSGCSAPVQGALVIGQVRDANSGLALDGAQVRIDDGIAVTTRTSGDPNIDAGFYALYAPTVAAAVIAVPGAGLPAGYGDAQVAATVATGATIRRDLALPAGRLRLYPAAPAASVELGSSGSATLTVSNVGTRALAYGFESVAIEEHFEGDTFPARGWSVVNHGAGCVWARPDRLQNVAGGDGLAAGIDLWQDCKGGGPIDTSLLSPVFDLGASSTASAGFFLSLLDGADSWPRLDVDVTTDGGASWTTVLSQTQPIATEGASAPTELDLSAFAGHAAVQLRFHYTASPPWGWVMVDQVHLFHAVAQDPTLGMTPDHGTLAAGASQEITVTFDASGIAQPGVYPIPLRVAEDTPYAWPFGEVEARMTVTAPASYGSVAGIVRGLGVCDLAPTPIAGASVRIQSAGGTVTTTTAADGSYQYWLDAAQAPLQVTVEAPDHLAATHEATLVAGTVTSADFDLRLLASCLMPDPASLSVAVAPGQTLQHAFDLLNGGPVAGDWSASIGGDPALQTPLPIAQTSRSEPDADTSFGCFNPGTGVSFENRYYRVFPPSDIPLPGDTRLISGIRFAVDSASSASGSQPVALRLHALSGEMTLANLSLLGETTVDASDTPLQSYRGVFDPPIEVASGTVLVAELRVPDGAGGGTSLYPGGSRAGESAPAYWVAEACGIAEPTTLPDLGFDWIHLIIELELLASDPCGAAATPVDWLGISPASGNLPGDSGTPLSAAFDASTPSPGEQRGSICFASGAARPLVMPVTMTVGSAADAIFADGFD